MPKNIKLTYFDFKGFGEPVRLALAIAGLDFEDFRIKREDWPAIKPTMPFGHVPVLEVDGQKVAQSGAMLRYIGKLVPESGLYPSDIWTAFKVDEIIGVVDDIMRLLRPSFATKDEDEIVRLRTALVAPEGELTLALAQLEASLAKTAGAKFALNDGPTIADISIYVILDLLSSGVLTAMPKDVYAKHPQLSKVVNAVRAHPKVKEWESKH
ncbi:cytochrome c oxidase subunit 1 [Geranomyces variabilis]|uniref:Cytochrome c oxidase subunit 1 n=1 Tax=Geranomyces variabilis TaxID=109894 RepID=A0AAD5TMY6_9FUNG|nr:cytochrome c oxidase subunit 1 [Geranomyces variabilis]